MADLNLNLRLRANADGSMSILPQTTRNVNQLSTAAQNANHSLAGAAHTLQSFYAVAAASSVGIAAAAAAKEVFDVNREYQSLRGSLTTLTGGMDNAALSFSFIKDFARENAQDIQQATEAYIKLGNLGLRPSEESLRSFGNTAAAQSKPIMQMIEAVADATTGEFERLKEFGIKAKQEGDNVTFTFQGVSTTVGNNAKDIERYLVNLGNTQFAGAMSRQTTMINGAITELGNSWDIFMDNILNDVHENMLARWVKDAGDAIHWLDVQMNGAISNKDKLMEIDKRIAQNRASVAANAKNGMVGSFIDDIAGYDPNLAKNRIDRDLKEREKLVKAMAEQASAQTVILNTIDKTDAATTKSTASAKTQAKEQKDAIKAVEDAQKSAYDAQIKQIERVAAAKLALNELDAKQLEFEYNRNNIGLKSYLAEKERLIRASTAAEIDALEKQKQAAGQFTGNMDAIHSNTKAFLSSEIASLDAAYQAILRIESSGGLKGQVNKTSHALGQMQVLPSTLRDPGYGVSPFKPAIDEKILQMSYDQLKSFVVRHDAELKQFGEDYFHGLVQHLGSIEKAVQAYGEHTPEYMAKFQRFYREITHSQSFGPATTAAKQFNDTMVAGASEQIDKAERIAALNGEINQLYVKQESDLADLSRFAITETDSYKQSLEELKVKYIELTGTAEEAFLARQKLNYAPLVKQATANIGPGTDNSGQEMLDQINKNQQAEKFKHSTDAAAAYQQKLAEINQSTQDMGVTSTEAFDLMHKGFGGLSTVFNGFISSLDKINESLKQNARAANETFTSGFGLAEQQELRESYTKKAIDLENQKTAAALTGVRQTAGAFADMFGENTKERKAFHAVEMTLGAIEVANSLTNNAAIIAGNAKAIFSNIATGASKIWGQMGIYAPIGLAVMAASLAAWGAMGGFGSHIASAPTPSPDTGSVLGDKTATSQSTGNIVELLKDIHASEYIELREINTGVASLSKGINDVITRLFQAGGLVDPQVDIFSNKIDRGAFQLITGDVDLLEKLPLIGGFISSIKDFFIGGIFGSTSQKITGGGIATSQQALIDAINGQVLDAWQYTIIETTKKSWFSKKVSYREISSPLDGTIQQAMSSVFQSMGSTMLGLAEQLGSDTKARVEAYVIPALRIDLQGLNAEDASKKLNGVISTVLDNMATTVFGDIIGQYQQLGEGMLETAVRIVAEVAVVKDALATSGLSMGADAIKISDQLAQAAGGLKEFQAQFATYYDKFYTDTEKQTRLQERLLGQLEGVYVGLPATRQGYRDLIEALDMSNAKDRERYSLLLQLSGAADEYYSSLENSLKTYEDAVKSAYSTAANLLKEQVSTYRGIVESLQAFSDQLTRGAASPADNYSAAKGDFIALRRVLNTGTEAEKEAALGQLQSVTQAYIDASKDYNASGLGYIKDMADAQALLAQEIGYSTGKADTAQQQLDALTDQVKALGLLNESVLSVKDAVDALNIAINGLAAFNASQAQTAGTSANKARFLAKEGARRDAYEAPIAAKAAAYGQRAENQGTGQGWSANTSINPFGASATVDAAGNISNQSVYGSSGEVTGHASSAIENIARQFAAIGKIAQELIGGTLPAASISISDSAGSGPGTESYRFNGITRSLNTDDIDQLTSLFANDAVDYLAALLPNKDWTTKIQAVPFSSLNSGFSELTTLMAHLRRPFKEGKYDPLKTYAMGGIANTASIFGEAGPEAAVPLPDGRTIPVSFVGGFPDWLRSVVAAPAKGDFGSTDKGVTEQLKKAVAVLEKCEKRLAVIDQHGAASVRVGQEGFKRTIAEIEEQRKEVEKANRRQRIKANK